MLRGLLTLLVVLILFGVLALGARQFATTAPPVVVYALHGQEQTFEGWGTSLAHWNEDARRVYGTDTFRRAYRDLGLNILRVDMQKEVLVASPDDLATPVRLDTDGEALDANAELMDFGIERVKVYGELGQWLQTNAIEPDRVKLTGALWSPPHWMKGPTGKLQNYIGRTEAFPTPFLSGMVFPDPGKPQSRGDSVGGRLLTDKDNLRQYGSYLAAWVKGYERAYGLRFHLVSLQNESTFENPFNSMTMEVNADGDEDFNQYAVTLDAVRDAWERHGLDTKVMGPHVANVGGSPDNPYNLRRQNGMIDAVRDFDETLIGFLDYYNANYYNGPEQGPTKNVAGFWLGADRVVPGEWGSMHRPRGVAGDGKPMWFSESSGESSDWPGALDVAVKIHNALVHGQASGYIYWQLADSGESASTYTLLGTDELEDPERSPKYAAFKQFSRFVRPGAVRLAAGFDDPVASTIGGDSVYDAGDGLSVSAFYHPGDRRWTLILINTLDVERYVKLTSPAGDPDHTIHTYRTSQAERFEEITGLVQNRDNWLYTAPAQSITTFTSAPSEP